MTVHKQLYAEKKKHKIGHRICFSAEIQTPVFLLYLSSLVLCCLVLLPSSSYQHCLSIKLRSPGVSVIIQIVAIQASRKCIQNIACGTEARTLLAAEELGVLYALFQCWMLLVFSP